MNSRITIYAMSNGGLRVRQFTISKFFIAFLLLVLTALLTLAGFGTHEYFRLRTEKFNTGELSREMEGNREIISVQRRQIQEFASEINTMKSQLLALSNFEKQIRVIANLEHPEAQKGLFGIGGSAPEDLDPKIDLKKKHDSLMREMHQQTDQLVQAGIVQEKNFETLIKELGAQKNLLKCTPAIWPADGILTSVFGNRESPFTGGAEFHQGLDIASSVGTPVIAPADGKVIFADTKGAYGKMMIINHGFGLVTHYGHLDEFLKKVGDTVTRGEKIGVMGNSGRSTGPHLHYEVHLNSVPVDPGDYILN